MIKYLYKTYEYNNDISIYRLNKNGSRTKFWTRHNGLTIKTQEITKGKANSLDEYLTKGYKYASEEYINNLMNHMIIRKLASKIERSEEKIKYFKEVINKLDNEPYKIGCSNYIFTDS